MEVRVELMLCLLLLVGWGSCNPRGRLKENLSLLPAAVEKNTKIVGGYDARIEEFPHQLSLRRRGVHGCGASIVALRWALSAAHCTFPVPEQDVLTLRAGSANRLAGGTIYGVEQIINHPLYSDYTMEFDVSLLRVGSDLVGQFITSVTLPPATSGYAPGTRANVSGWGLQTVPGTLPVQLQWIDVPLISTEECRNYWPSDWITEEMLCAGELSRDTCNGDSGDPLVVHGYQMGVSSWGSNDCSGRLPAIYASTAHPTIRSFIQEHTGV
ncbi:trypsin 3A1-like [Anopheles bellator]|uniref:trypsin 3A1-like n=1 Tax=Anopheles bellator TaxID=139047 RepID=UPI002649EBF1|nr:trypsin 3A1-like [Anopheles bellator]